MFWIQVRAHFFKEGFVESVSFLSFSGFIIAYNYQEKLLTKTTTKRTFWVARIACIYPLHLLTLLIAACIGGYVQYSRYDGLDQTLCRLYLSVTTLLPLCRLFLLFQQSFMEFGVRTVILFLLSFRDSFLKQQAKTIGYTLNLSSGHAGRYVSDCRRTNQGILVCQSHHPPAGLFCGSITLSDLSGIT